MFSKRKSLRLGGGSPLLLMALLVLPAAAGWASMAISIRMRLLSNALTVTSTADALVDLRSGTFGYVLLPLFLLFLQNTLKNDLNAPFVVRSRHRREIWHTQSVKVLLYSLLLALFFTLWALTLGLFFGEMPINWDSPFSAYYNATHTANPDARLWQVLLATFGSYTLALLGAGLLFLLLWWAVDHPVVPWLGILALQQVENAAVVGKGISVLFARAAIGYDNWNEHTILPGFAVAAVVCIALYLLGRVLICKRKEFYR